MVGDEKWEVSKSWESEWNAQNNVTTCFEKDCKQPSINWVCYCYDGWMYRFNESWTGNQSYCIKINVIGYKCF